MVDVVVGALRSLISSDEDQMYELLARRPDDAAVSTVKELKPIEVFDEPQTTDVFFKQLANVVTFGLNEPLPTAHGGSSVVETSGCMSGGNINTVVPVHVCDTFNTNVHDLSNVNFHVINLLHNSQLDDKENYFQTIPVVASCVDKKEDNGLQVVVSEVEASISINDNCQNPMGCDGLVSFDDNGQQTVWNGFVDDNNGGTISAICNTVLVDEIQHTEERHDSTQNAQGTASR